MNSQRPVSMEGACVSQLLHRYVSATFFEGTRRLTLYGGCIGADNCTSAKEYRTAAAQCYLPRASGLRHISPRSDNGRDT